MHWYNMLNGKKIPKTLPVIKSIQTFLHHVLFNYGSVYNIYWKALHGLSTRKISIYEYCRLMFFAAVMNFIFMCICLNSVPCHVFLRKRTQNNVILVKILQCLHSIFLFAFVCLFFVCIIAPHHFISYLVFTIKTAFFLSTHRTEGCLHVFILLIRDGNIIKEC